MSKQQMSKQEKKEARARAKRVKDAEGRGRSGVLMGILVVLAFTGLVLGIMAGVSALVMVFWNGVMTKVVSYALVIDFWTAFWYIGFWAGIVAFYMIAKAINNRS